MPDIGYYTLPVIPSFKGITAQVQSDLDKAFKGAGAAAGKIMVQSATETLTKDPSLNKAIQTAPAAMDAITKATDKQSVSVTKLRAEEKKLQDVRGTGDKQVSETGRIVVAEEKVISTRQKQVDQIKVSKTANDELAQSIKKVNDESARAKDITTGTGSSGGSSGTGIGDSLKNDLNKALGGDTSGAGADLGNQLGKAIGSKIGSTLRTTVQEVTGTSVDNIVDKVKGAGQAIGVDVGSVVSKAIAGDKAGAISELGTQLGAKLGSVVGEQVKDVTGIDLGQVPGLIQGARNTLGNVRQSFGAARADPSSIYGGGGPSNEVSDALSGASGLLGDVGDLGSALGSKRLGGLSKHADTLNALSGLINHGVQDAQPDKGWADILGDVATSAGAGAGIGAAVPFLDATGIPEVIGGIAGLGTGIAHNWDALGKHMPWHHDAEPAGPTTEDTLYNGVFGSGGGGSGSVSTEDMQVDASVATIQAGSVSLGGSISLPASMTGGISTGDAGSAGAGSIGSAGAGSGSEDSLYAGDSGGSYFSGGGGPKGTDTVAAWLTPGEIVVDKPTSDKMRQLFGGGASYYAGGTGIGGAGGPIGAAGTDPYKGPRGSANDPIFTMPSQGYAHAIDQQVPSRSGGAAGLGGALGQSALGGLDPGQLGGIGQQFLSDTLGMGGLFPDPTSDPLVQAGMNMMQSALGMAMQPGGLKGALTSDAAGKKTFGGMFGGDDSAGGGFGMIPNVAGLPHPDDMADSPGDAAFGDALSTGVPGAGDTHVDNSQHVTVNGHSAQEVGNQVYRNLRQTGLPNTPRMNTHVPVGG